jgi:ATP-dependent RNA helicase DDX49/DBP8
MPKDDSARKRRRVDAAGTSQTTEETTGAVVFDDEAMKRHMLSLMQQPANGKSQRTDSEDDGEEEQESDDSDDGSEDGSADSVDEEADSISEGGPEEAKRVEEELNSDDEDQDETARALLQGRGTTKSEPNEEAASRISRIPTNRNTTAAPKKPILKTTFEGLGLSPQLIRTLAGISIRKPTEIQSACFEHILNGKLPDSLYSSTLTH